VGYDRIQFAPVSFCPVVLGSYSYGDLYVPQGSYRLSEAEILPFLNHATYFTNPLDAALELACSRLADAQVRLQPRDRLIDAVIGLEAILLAPQEQRSGELRYRFSINYASLFTVPADRHRAFRVAKDLYDLRSTLAHGSVPNETNRVGDERLSIADAATRACAALREVLVRFLATPGAHFRNSDFWERGYFGLT
jgi:hypothetical protein